MGPWSWGCYGSCEGLAGTLNKLANRGNGRTAVDQSHPQFNFMTTETKRPHASLGAKRTDDERFLKLKKERPVLIKVTRRSRFSCCSKRLTYCQ